MKGTTDTVIVGDSMLRDLADSKMSQKKLIKVRMFPGATIWDMKIFVVPRLKKKPDNIIIHVETNNAPRSSSYEMFHEIKSIYNLRDLPSRHRYCVPIRPMQMILTKPLQNWSKNLT